MHERRHGAGQRKKTRRRSQERWRAPVEKRRRVLRQRISLLLLFQETHDREVVAKNPHAALGGPAAFRERRGRVGAFADRREYVQIDSRLHRRGVLVRVKRLEDPVRAWFWSAGGARLCGHCFPLGSKSPASVRLRL